MDMPLKNAAGQFDVVKTFGEHSRLLTRQLKAVREQMYPPDEQKKLRYFSTAEAADLIGVSVATLKSMSDQGKGPSPARLPNNNRIYTLNDINVIRAYLAESRPKQARKFLHHRRPGEHLQVIAAANFKGGSAKTTSALHLAHYLAIKGLRVLAVDLDPQGSLTSMFGMMPELDLSEDQSVMACLRYDEPTLPVEQVIQKTYFDGLDLLPAALDLAEFEFQAPLNMRSNHDKSGPIFFERLHLAIKPVQDNYDVVILDTPPNLGYLSLNAIYAATAVVVTIHPAMLDVASLSSFLKNANALARAIHDHGGDMSKDFMHYLLTRHDPRDEPQMQIASLLRSLFGEHVLVQSAFESTAIGSAGLAKRSIYEVEPGEILRSTLKRSRESMDSVNEQILKSIHKAWGRR